MQDDAPTFETPSTPTPGEAARFLPGHIVAERFRIVAPLGRGGMGEVYRADDLKLGHPVALKFLPRALHTDPQRMKMLLEEVKLARQVSHPNVCRVWDVGESNGQPFLAMEYVDGETLESLLRRIGRIPEDRGVRIARELCAGLAAVHDQGLLHRDLKPSNVMLDGRGRVRLTDFGVAALAGEGGKVRSASGTPAYMAPEQRAQGESSVKSDIYALGLVLFELFTGKKAQGGDPGTSMGTLDPAIEKAILSCLAPAPAARPASAAAVARALPGGNNQDLLLGENETPSPEMVAAAGGTGGLKPWAAVGLAVACVAGTIGLLMLSEWRGLPFKPEDKSYGALRDRAQEFVRTLGPTSPKDDVRDGYSRTDSTVQYWYRVSPTLVPPVVSDDRYTSLFTGPALETKGERALRFDVQGRLLEYRALPLDSSAALGYASFFRAAGLESLGRVPTTATFVLQSPADAESAWTVGRRHVEGRSRHGVVTAFVVDRPDVPQHFKRSSLVGGYLGLAFQIAILITAIYLAARNLRLGRADVRGAFILAVVGTLGSFFGWGVLVSPQLDPYPWYWALGIAVVCFWGLLTAASYLGLEPIIRRRQPEWLTSWARLLDGRWLDSRVGRDLMIGLLGGLLLVTLNAVSRAHAPRIGDYQAAAIGGWQAFALLLRSAQGLTLAFMSLLTLVVFQIVLRRRWLGWLVWVPFMTFNMASAYTAVGFAGGLARTVVLVALIRIGGLWSLSVAFFAFTLMNEEYLTTQIGAWYGGVTMTVVLTVGALLAWGLLASLRVGPRSAV